MTIGASNVGPDTLATVSWKVERTPMSAMNCFGIVSRDSGHTRVPAPPHMMTGSIFVGISSGAHVLNTDLVYRMRSDLR